ncbi:MAG: Crp/Fnr family transcriptional regulator [Deltaproteobacteria bacterium]|nr:Crp/Fnr family transcriptional regulator [Deltaproteobacteria bacterium]
MRTNQEFVHNNPLFKGLFDSDPGELDRVAQSLFIKKRQVAYRPGDLSDSIYVLKSGRVKICKITEDGREIILNMLKPGDIFGEMAFLEDGPRDSFAEALDDTNVVLFKKADLLQLIKRRPAITYRLAKVVGERRREAEKAMENFLYKGVRERLANLLLRLGEDYGIKDSRGKLLRIKITHQDLANLIGSSRETVSLTLGDFRREGYIDINERKIIIKDERGLHALN